MDKRNTFFLGKLFCLFLLFMCCHFEIAEILHPSSQDEARLAEAFDKFEVIGEGSDFLTVKIDLPLPVSTSFVAQVYGLIVDKDNYPLRKVSGYAHNPELKGKNHLWFYFFLFAPGEWPSHLRKSDSIKFIVQKNRKTLLERSVKYPKLWENKGEAKTKIYDPPSPPDQIKGYLILKDYTFLAQGDFRKPEGFYVEGKIMGKDGRWTHFVTLSDIKGHEPDTEYILPVAQGWLELETGKTHAMQEAISPRPPYVEGWWDGKGYFHPYPVKVQGLKKE